MTLQERIAYQLSTEVDQYINLVAEKAIGDKNVVKFIVEYVVPRLHRMRGIIAGYDETSYAVKEDKKIKLLGEICIDSINQTPASI